MPARALVGAGGQALIFVGRLVGQDGDDRNSRTRRSPRRPSPDRRADGRARRRCRRRRSGACARSPPPAGNQGMRHLRKALSKGELRRGAWQGRRRCIPMRRARQRQFNGKVTSRMDLPEYAIEARGLVQDLCEDQDHPGQDGAERDRPADSARLDLRPARPMARVNRPSSTSWPGWCARPPARCISGIATSTTARARRPRLHWRGGAGNRGRCLLHPRVAGGAGRSLRRARP